MIKLKIIKEKNNPFQVSQIELKIMGIQGIEKTINQIREEISEKRYRKSKGEAVKEIIRNGVNGNAQLKDQDAD